MEKEFKSIEEQIEKLKDKNLIISSKRKVYKILENNNYYYLINGYKDLFIDKINRSAFIEGTKLEELFALYNFDGEIRLNFLKYILLIERRVNTYIAYEFSKQYGHKKSVVFIFPIALLATPNLPNLSGARSPAQVSIETARFPASETALYMFP